MSSGEGYQLILCYYQWQKQGKWAKATGRFISADQRKSLNESYCTIKQLAQALSFLPLERCIIRIWKLPVKNYVKKVYALRCRKMLLTLKMKIADNF